MFLILLDAHSTWPEVVPMPSTTASQTIEALQIIFSKYGLPEQLVSDNGPQFSSDEFAQFMKANGVKHIRSAPYHPSSNGLAERFVQTFKRAMKAGEKGGGSLNTGYHDFYSIIDQHLMQLQTYHLLNCFYGERFELDLIS